MQVDAMTRVWLHNSREIAVGNVGEVHLDLAGDARGCATSGEAVTSAVGEIGIYFKVSILSDSTYMKLLTSCDDEDWSIVVILHNKTAKRQELPESDRLLGCLAQSEDTRIIELRLQEEILVRFRIGRDQVSIRQPLGRWDSSEVDWRNVVHQRLGVHLEQGLNLLPSDIAESQRLIAICQLKVGPSRE